MEYKLNVNGKTVETNVTEIDVTPGSDGTFEAGMDGRDRTVSFSRVSRDRLLLKVDGRQIQVWTGQDDEGTTLFLDGHQYRVQDENETGTPRKRSRDEAPSEVTPPMPAVVVAVPVGVGDVVAQGDACVIISAMKMETRLTAPHGGTVTRVGVKEGDKVMPGEILVDIEKESI